MRHLTDTDWRTFPWEGTDIASADLGDRIESMLQGFPEAVPPSVEVLNLAERERANPWRRVPLEHTESHPLNNAETILASNRWSTDAEIVRSGILTQQDGCWFWTGMLNDHGYGRVTRSVDGRTVGAPVHQLVWLESRVLRWPQGMIARHLCRNRDCCAADHITPGTHLENVHDAQFRDGTMPISIHRLPEELQERVRAGEAVEWNGVALELDVPPSTDYRPYVSRCNQKGGRSRGTAAVLAFLLGWLGLHRFYLGQPGRGVLFLILTLSGIGVWLSIVCALIDGVRFWSMSDADFERRYNAEG